MTARSLRMVLFAVVAVVQLAVAGGAVFRSELALRTGEVFRFRIEPVDPVDAFRGRYLAIRFALDRAPVPDGFELKSRQWVFVPLRVDRDGLAAFGTAAIEPPEAVPYLRLRSRGIYPDDDGELRLWVTLPFTRFYLNEDVTPEAERMVWSGPQGQHEASVTVRVRKGVGVLEELYIDDAPIAQWLAEHASEQR